MTLAQSSERHDSWKEIAAYLRRDERTVQRWERECALPVHRTPGRRRGSVFAYRQELDPWLAGQNPTPPPPSAAISSPPQSQPRRRRSLIRTGVLVAVFIMAAGLVKLRHHNSAAAIRLALAEDRVIGMDQQG